MVWGLQNAGCLLKGLGQLDSRQQSPRDTSAATTRCSCTTCKHCVRAVSTGAKTWHGVPLPWYAIWVDWQGRWSLQTQGFAFEPSSKIPVEGLPRHPPLLRGHRYAHRATASAGLRRVATYLLRRAGRRHAHPGHRQFGRDIVSTANPLSHWLWRTGNSESGIGHLTQGPYTGVFPLQPSKELSDEG